MKRIAVIGFGCAGFSAARAVRDVDTESEVDIYSDTEEAPYNPMLTTYYVSGKIKEGTMFPLGDLDKISAQLKVNILCSSPVSQLHAKEREIILADGTGRYYDDIVISTGARAVIPPIKNLPAHDIYTMRTASDARRLEKALHNGIKSAVVVGAQMVGIKVVELLWRRGIKTVFADMEKHMFPASAYPDIAEETAKRLTDAGIDLRLGAAITAIEECGERLHSVFSDGGDVESDIVVFCSGIRPNIAFVDRDELDVGMGIKTDLRMETNVPHIYAAGDCCETMNILTGKNAYIGLWANSALQGRVAGHNIAGMEDSYPGNLIQNITHYMDMDFISVGDVKADGRRISWQKKDGTWRVEATISDGRIAALNILDNANVSGPVKNVLLHQATHPGEKMSVSAKMILVREGMPADIIALLEGAKI